MTAPEPTAEHIDAVATLVADRVLSDFDTVMNVRLESREIARTVLTSTDPAVHAALAASLPAEVKAASLTDAEMLAALVDRGALTAEDAPIARHGGYEHTHWQQRWDGQHTHEGRRFVTPWEVAE